MTFSKITTETAFRQCPLLIQMGDAMLAVENAQWTNCTHRNQDTATVARNSSNALLSVDFSLNCQVTIVASSYDKRINYW